MTKTNPFAAAVDHARRWLDEVSTALGDEDRELAWSALRAVLQTLRDRLTHEEAAHLAAQLPLIVRGAFYEGWRPARTPARTREPELFLGEIGLHLGPRRLGQLDPERAFHAVIAALERCGLGPELAQVRQQLQKPLQELWSAPAPLPP